MEFFKKLFQILFGWLSRPGRPPIDDGNDDDNDGGQDTNDGGDNLPIGMTKFPYRAEDTDEVGLTPGFEYTIEETDVMEGTNAISFDKVGDHHGMHSTSLREFNTDELYRAGDVVYIPSVDELCFAEYCRRTNDLNAAVVEYMEMPSRPNRAMLDAARYRGAGIIGEKYALLR